jgi:hypothetical protein
MVPDDFHDFFIGAITVAGALVGLLFVAISVHPNGLADDTRVVMRVRATAALMAFLDPLFLSLVALLPGGAVGTTAVYVGSAGAVSMVTLLIAVLARRAGVPVGQLISTLALILGQGAIYVWQIVAGFRLDPSGPDAPGVRSLASAMVIFFVFGVFRAWEFVGGRRTGILGTVDELRHRPAPAGPDEDEKDEVSKS